MNTLSIGTTKTMTYNAEEAAKAFAVVERIVSLARTGLTRVRTLVASRGASTFHAART